MEGSLFGRRNFVPLNYLAKAFHIHSVALMVFYKTTVDKATNEPKSGVMGPEKLAILLLLACLFIVYF